MDDLEEGRCHEVPTSDSFPFRSYWDGTGLAASVRGRHAYRTSRTYHTESKQSHTHKALTETVGAQVSDFGRQLQKFERTYGDQQDTVIKTHLETQSILKKHDSLAQSMGTQHIEIRALLQSQAREQTRVRESQKSAVAQISDEIQTLSGFVFFLSLIRKARSDASNI